MLLFSQKAAVVSGTGTRPPASHPGPNSILLCECKYLLLMAILNSLDTAVRPFYNALLLVFGEQHGIGGQTQLG